MSQNHPNDNIYSILGKLSALDAKNEPKVDTQPKTKIYESVDARGSITDGVSLVQSKLEQKFLTEGKSKNNKYAIGMAAAKKSAGYGNKPAKNIPKSVVKKAHKIAKEIDESVEHTEESSSHESRDAVASAITRRILVSRSDLLAKFGPEKVLQAIEEVAEWGSDVEEIGTSDVSAWVSQVERYLRSANGEGIQFKGIDVDEEHELDMPASALNHMNSTNKEFYTKNPNAMRGDRSATSTGTKTVNAKGHEINGLAFKVTPQNKPAQVKRITGTKFNESDVMHDPFGRVPAKPPTTLKGKTVKGHAGAGEEHGDKTRNKKADDAYYKDHPEDHSDFRKNMAKKATKSVTESVAKVGSKMIFEANFKRMLDEKHQTVEEMMAKLSDDMKMFKETGIISELLQDCMEMHRVGKQVTDEARPGTYDVPPSMRTNKTPLTPSDVQHHDIHGKLSHAKNLNPNKPYPPVQPKMPIELDELDQLAELAGLTVDEESRGDYIDDLKSDAKAHGKHEIHAFGQDMPVDEESRGDYIDDLKSDAKAHGKHEIHAFGQDMTVDESNVDAELEEMMKLAGMSVREGKTEDDVEVEVNQPKEEPVNNAEKNKYFSMKGSTMNPGEGDFGEKNMYGGKGDNKMTQPPSRPAKPVSVKESTVELEARLAAEYESIKKAK